MTEKSNLYRICTERFDNAEIKLIIYAGEVPSRAALLNPKGFRQRRFAPLTAKRVFALSFMQGKKSGGTAETFCGFRPFWL